MKHPSEAQKKKYAGRTGSGIPVQATPEKKEKQPASPGFLSIRSLLFSLLLLGFLGIVRHIQSYKHFFIETIDDAYEKIPLIRDIDDYKSLKTRKEMRWGYSYYWLVKMKEFLKKDSNAIVLLPPNDYIKTINPGQTLPEPAVGYYYSGVKTAWGTSDYAYKCTYYYKPNKKGEGPAVVQLSGKAQIDSLLQLYKGYKYSY